MPNLSLPARLLCGLVALCMSCRSVQVEIGQGATPTAAVEAATRTPTSAAQPTATSTTTPRPVAAPTSESPAAPSTLGPMVISLDGQPLSIDQLPSQETYS